MALGRFSKHPKDIAIGHNRIAIHVPFLQYQAAILVATCMTNQ
jgi:hypothetical protein